MSIDGINAGQPSFAGKTKSGNDYDKTCGGKIAGGFMGVHVAATNLRKAKLIKDEVIIAKQTENFMKRVAKNPKINMTGAEFTAKLTKNIGKTRAVGNFIGAAMTIGIWIGIGSIVDKAINSHRKSKADKAAD